jgi:hypothetical protein
LPNYCSECGTKVYLDLKTGEYTRILDDNTLMKWGTNDTKTVRLPD